MLRKKMKKNRGFTLVELLIVIAIIGVLIGLLTPAISSAQRMVSKTNTKSFLINMQTALMEYKNVYYKFPDFLTDMGGERLNLADSGNAEKMVKALTGKDCMGNPLNSADRRSFNERLQPFMDFNDKNLVNQGGTWRLIDAFYNPNIYVCLDATGSGFVKKGLPTAGKEDGLSPNDVKMLVPNPVTGIRGSIIMFTLKKDASKPGAAYSAENVFSWQ